MKNSWKVLPFHINSNDAGSSEYNQRKGTAKASNGKTFINVFMYFVRGEGMICVLRYRTRVDVGITVSVRSKKKMRTLEEKTSVMEP
jgi:hypothetical protein